MIFSSLTFLFVFLPIVLSIYYLSSKNIKNLVLLISSLIFYAWGEPIYIGLMIFSSIVDFIHGILVEKYNKLGEFRKAKVVLFSSIFINLSLLMFFKYADFFILNINSIFNLSINTFNLPLPIGISFYTFQTMSYTIDVYKGDVAAQKSPIALATYVTLFPQLIAGPIVRYKTISDQINNREVNTESFAVGIKRFIIGLGKKVLLANNIGMLWDQIQNVNIGELTVLTAWLGTFAFAMQIYFDFSGYSDMAIGLGKIFGFDFLENFNYPFISQSITEFWRRWHISLGTWFKDYVYIPLGGSKGGLFKTIRNLFIVWFITGFWHGASWNFVLWGIYFGIFIGLEKLFILNVLKKLWRPIRHLYVVFILSISWVLFSHEEIGKAVEYLKVMFGLIKNNVYDAKFIYFLMTNLVLIIVLILLSTPIICKLNEYFKSEKRKAFVYVNELIISLTYFIIFIVSIAYLADAAYNPFLYFRF